MPDCFSYIDKESRKLGALVLSTELLKAMSREPNRSDLLELVAAYYLAAVAPKRLSVEVSALGERMGWKSSRVRMTRMKLEQLGALVPFVRKSNGRSLRGIRLASNPPLTPYPKRKPSLNGKSPLKEGINLTREKKRGGKHPKKDPKESPLYSFKSIDPPAPRWLHRRVLFEFMRRLPKHFRADPQVRARVIDWVVHRKEIGSPIKPDSRAWLLAVNQIKQLDIGGACRMITNAVISRHRGLYCDQYLKPQPEEDIKEDQEYTAQVLMGVVYKLTGVKARLEGPGVCMCYAKAAGICWWFLALPEGSQGYVCFRDSYGGIRAFVMLYQEFLLKKYSTFTGLDYRMLGPGTKTWDKFIVAEEKRTGLKAKEEG